MFHTLSTSIKRARHEFSELERLFSRENRESRRLVFYSEGGFYSRYFLDYMEFVLDQSDLDICYLTSDALDPIFQTTCPRIKPFYFKNLLSSVFARLDAKALVMTAPDLHRCGIRRAPDSVKHIYVFHGVSSIQQSYRLGAFDFYDAMLCINPMQVEEFRESERIYKTKPKELILTGYPYIERLYREHPLYQRKLCPKQSPLCLIAPTWAPLNYDSTIMDNGILPLLQCLAETDYEVWLRPHNEYIKRNPGKMQMLQSMVARFGKIKIQTDLNSERIVHEADVLVTDHSSIAYDFALGTERPVLFIDTPTRLDNHHRNKLGVVPFENIYRSKIGKCLPISQLNEAGAALMELKNQEKQLRKQLTDVRADLLSNWQRSASVGGSYIISACLRA